LRKLPRFAALALAVAAVAACSSEMVAPKTLYGYRGVERLHAGAVARPDGERLKRIKPLDPEARMPLLVQAMTEVAKLDPERRWRGITYDLTTDNLLGPGWLHQTPDIWGTRAADLRAIVAGCTGCDHDFELPACAHDGDCATGTCGHLDAFETGAPARVSAPRCLGHSERFLDAIYDIIVRADSAVDIGVLADLPDIRFRGTLRNAVTALAYSGRAVTIRLIVGQYPSADANVDEFLEQLLRDARHAEESRLTVFVGATQSCAGQSDCASYSWNHAKIVAADGRVALVGGHNMWSRDYLMAAPVHDVSMVLRGSAAADADRFLDQLWAATCARKGKARSVAYRADQPHTDDGCLAHLPLPPARPGPGHTAVMTVARLAGGIADDFADHGDIAEQLVLGAAQHVIRVSQQDLGFSLLHVAEPIWPEAVLRAFADLLTIKGGEVFVVLSQPEAESIAGTDYSTGVSLEQVAGRLREVVRRRAHLPDAEVDALLCRNFHLAPLRFGPDPAWPGGHKIANHAKFWMVDQRAFHIGSHNLYPVDLQEFGYIVEDRAAATTVLRDYWEKLWRYSRAAAISGSDAPRCVFDKTPPAS
jgi:phosphatidylserine/phosphatidylglycerophosphate/cardiolipin synthase-like enzyme